MNQAGESYIRKWFDVNVRNELDLMRPILRKVQVNVPIRMLCESYLSVFTSCGINPEVGIDAAALEEYDSSAFDEVGRELRKAHLSVTLHAPFMDLSPGSTDPAVRALTRHRFDQTLRVMEGFNPKTVVCHAGYDAKRYGFIEDTWLENSLEIWSRLALRIRERGARLMLENVFEHDPSILVRLMERLHHLDVGFCLDTGHHAAFARTPLALWLKDLGPYLGQLHLHDNQGLRDDHSTLGSGIIDFPMLFESLRGERIRPPIVTLEPHREEDFIPSLKYLEKVLPW